MTFLTKWGRYGLLFESLGFFTSYIIILIILTSGLVTKGTTVKSMLCWIGWESKNLNWSLCLVLMTIWSECIYQKHLCGNLAHRQSPIPLCLWMASGWCATGVAWQQMRRTDKLLTLVPSSTSISSMILFTYILIWSTASSKLNIPKSWILLPVKQDALTNIILSMWKLKWLTIVTGIKYLTEQGHQLN